MLNPDVSSATVTKSPTIDIIQALQTNTLQAYIECLVEKLGIPAISLAIWHKGQCYQAAAGVLNVETGVEATTDSVFQVGSITKVFTASMMMQLVEAGGVALDMPVKHYLRDFRVIDPEVTEKVTVRQLLNHTNGLAGDFLPDDAVTGGNPIARYLDRCYLLPQVHPLGTHHSYSNAAYSIAGRLIEVVSGLSWFDAMDTQIIQPLGLSHTFVNPLNALRFRTAMGHFPDLDNTPPWKLAPACYLPLGLAPAGSTLSMTATDLITFARAHLNKGAVSALSKTWLSADAIQHMQAPSITLPAHSPQCVTDWGLGWFLINAGATPVIGHDGGTFGQSAMLRLVPEQDLAIALQTNGSKPAILSPLCADLLVGLAGIHLAPPEANGELVNPEQVAGVYESFDSVIEVRLVDRELVATLTDKIQLGPAKTLILKSLTPDAFAAYDEQGRQSSTAVFIDRDQQGVPIYLAWSFRLHRRVH